jgi:hypothetical protein
MLLEQLIISLYTVLVIFKVRESYEFLGFGVFLGLFLGFGWNVGLFLGFEVFLGCFEGLGEFRAISRVWGFLGLFLGFEGVLEHL